MADLVNIQIPRKCLIRGCDSISTQVPFFGDLCPACYAFLTERKGGENSAAFRFAMGWASRVLSGTTQVVAARLLDSYWKGVLKFDVRERRTQEYDGGDEDDAIIRAGGRGDANREDS